MCRKHQLDLSGLLVCGVSWPGIKIKFNILKNSQQYVGPEVVVLNLNVMCVIFTIKFQVFKRFSHQNRKILNVFLKEQNVYVNSSSSLPLQRVTPRTLGRKGLVMAKELVLWFMLSEGSSGSLRASHLATILGYMKINFFRLLSCVGLNCTRCCSYK